MSMKRPFQRMMTALTLLLAAAATTTSSVEELSRMITNYPNPFDSRAGGTTILFDLAAEATVRPRIYDLFGNLVREYGARREPAGAAALVWDGTDDTGRKVAKGGYLCVITIDYDTVRLVATRKIGVVH